MPHRADIFHSEMRYYFTNYWKTEWGIMLNKLDWEGFKNMKLNPIWKSLKKQIYLIAHYNQRWFSIKAELLQSTNSFIFHKCQFSVRPNLYIVIWQEPQEHLAVLWYSHNFLRCVSLSACRDWETSQKCCAGLCYSFPGQEFHETCRLPTKRGEHWPQLLQHPPIQILRCTLQNLMRRHLPDMLHRFPSCTQACVPCGQIPHLLDPEAQQLEKGVQNRKIWIIPRQIFFSSSPSSLLEIPRSLSSELPEPLRLFLHRQMKSLFSCEGYLAHMQVIWRN